MKKIVNKPNQLAVKEFTYIWDSIDTNIALRDIEFNNENSLGINTKWIGEYCKYCDGDDDYGWSAFMIVILFVKEYNAFYMAGYTRQYRDKYDIIHDDDSQVLEDELRFELIPEGTFQIPSSRPKQALSNKISLGYDKLNGLKKL